MKVIASVLFYHCMGWGFLRPLRPANGDDVFYHRSEIQEEKKFLIPGELVEYIPGTKLDRRTGTVRPYATNIRRVSEIANVAPAVFEGAVSGHQ